MVWPPVDGRLILHETSSRQTHLERDSQGGWTGSIDHRWSLHSAADAVFDNLDAGRAELVQWARQHVAGDELLSKQRCIVLAADGHVVAICSPSFGSSRVTAETSHRTNGGCYNAWRRWPGNRFPRIRICAAGCDAVARFSAASSGHSGDILSRTTIVRTSNPVTSVASATCR